MRLERIKSFVTFRSDYPYCLVNFMKMVAQRLNLRVLFSSALHFSLNDVSNEELSKRDVFSIVTMSEGIK